MNTGAMIVFIVFSICSLELWMVMFFRRHKSGGDVDKEIELYSKEYVSVLCTSAIPFIQAIPLILLTITVIRRIVYDLRRL